MPTDQDFNKALEETFDQYSKLQPNSLDKIVCHGRLEAFNAVLNVFSRIDARRFAATH